MSQVINLRKKTFQDKDKKVGFGRQFKTNASKEKQKDNNQKPEEQNKQTKIFISWQAPSFYHNPSGKVLYPLLVLLFASGVFVLISRENILMGIFLILSSIILLAYSNKKPEICSVEINQRGVGVDNRFYPYREIKSFWIHYEVGGIKELSLESKKWHMPYIKIIIDERQNPLAIRSSLIQFVPEKEHERSIIEIFSRLIGL